MVTFCTDLLKRLPLTNPALANRTRMRMRDSLTLCNTITLDYGTAYTVP